MGIGVRTRAFDGWMAAQVDSRVCQARSGHANKNGQTAARRQDALFHGSYALHCPRRLRLLRADSGALRVRRLPAWGRRSCVRLRGSDICPRVYIWC